ncbi:pre-mRNA-splicing factor Cwc2p [Diutina catenulata]
MDNPARLQVDPAELEDVDVPQQTGAVFNIWYKQWAFAGDDDTLSKFRVDIQRDQGYTRATGPVPICVYFARGCCYKGEKCTFYHRLPEATDGSSGVHDCFGRDRTATPRDDMNGVGVINVHNRTVWVGKLNVTKNMEDVVKKAFGEFGTVEKCRVLPAKRCAFVTYRLESSAQFAKEALDRQSLTENDVIVVRWANEDRNPQAQREEQRRKEEIAEETVKQLMAELASKKKEEEEEAVPAKRSPSPEPAKEVEDLPQPKRPRKLDFSSTLAKLGNGTEKEKPAALTNLGYDSSDEE